MKNQELNQYHRKRPRFFYGYIVVATAFFVMVVSWGSYNVFGVFFNPLLADFGWTRAMISGTFSLSMIISGVIGIVMGGLTDRFGPRMVVTISCFFLGLGYLLMSQVNTLWQLYLFFGVVIGTGMSGLWVPLISPVARWFVSRRSLMTGIVITGTGISRLIAPPVVSRLIASHGWRLSYSIIGGIVLVATILAAQLLKRDPAQMGQQPYGVKEARHGRLNSDIGAFSLNEATHTVQFWLSSLMFFCLGFCMFTVMVHIVPHAIDLEISAVSAANILATSGGASILGNFVMGGVADRIGSRNVFLIGFILLVIVFSCLVLVRETWLLYLLSIIFGFAQGGMAPAESTLLAGLFGLSSHGLIFGVAGIGFTIGAAVGPFITGYIFDVTGSYQAAFLLCAACGVIGVISAAILRPTRRSELQK